MTMYLLCLLFWLLLLLLLVVFLALYYFLHSILSKDHAGYLQPVRTPLICCFSVLSRSGVDKTALVLCAKVLMTLHLAPMW